MLSMKYNNLRSVNPDVYQDIIFSCFLLFEMEADTLPRKMQIHITAANPKNVAGPSVVSQDYISNDLAFRLEVESGFTFKRMLFAPLRFWSPQTERQLIMAISMQQTARLRPKNPMVRRHIV